MKPKIIIVSGYFNPLHKGHIELFHLAKKIADFLYVIINNDHQRELKETKKFMLEDERCLIIRELKIVDRVFLSLDLDKTVITTIEYIHSKFYTTHDLIFANGGDKKNNEIPEAEICKKLNIKLIDRLGEKIQSSSWLLKDGN